MDGTQQPIDENVKEFSAEISVAAALELFEDKNDPDRKIRMRCQDSIKSLSVSDLLKGFANYKAKTDART